MFGRKKESKRPPRSGGQQQVKLSAFGLMDVPSIDELEHAADLNEDDDAALEAELQDLMASGAREKPPGRRKAPAVPEKNLESMVAACMRDIPSDEDMSDTEDDPSLLAELEFLGDAEADVKSPAPPAPMAPQTVSYPREVEEMPLAGGDLLQTIDDRIANYTAAQARAQSADDSARARRFGRGLATLARLRRNVVDGTAVNDSDIPPAVTLKEAEPKANTQPTSPMQADTPSQAATEASPMEPAPHPADLQEPQPKAPLQPTSPAAQEESGEVSRVKAHREKCKATALQARSDDDKPLAFAALKAVKECDVLLKQLQAGEIFTVDVLPTVTKAPPKQSDSLQSEATGTPPAAPTRQFSRDDPIRLPDNPEDIPPADPALFGAPPPPKTVSEALEQRLLKYRQDEAKAKQEGNSAKVRRLGRICKQYENAIKLNKSGRPIPVNDLPTPPGFAPIPIGVPLSAGLPGPAATAAAPAAATPSRVAAAASTAPSTSARAGSGKPKTFQEKQIALLQAQQAQFKAAALEAKKAGQIDQAKDYLRHYKGFDKVIEAAKGGLPVDLKTLPVPPQRRSGAGMEFEIVRHEDCEPSISGDRRTMYAKLEKDLVAQAKMCGRNSDHFRATGDVATANKFQQMMEYTKKDLDTLRFAFKRNEPVPKFHYEIRAFSRVVCHADLTDTELELSVLTGINFGAAKETDTYCKLELPYPKENPFKERTPVMKASSNPEYNFKCIMPINPKDKSFQRACKRQSVKVEVWAKGGFFRSDNLVGTVQIKLQPLETVCDIHDTFALMDGRRAVGGKLEVRIRTRNPLLTKQIEKVQEKWLVISFK